MWILIGVLLGLIAFGLLRFVLVAVVRVVALVTGLIAGMFGK